MKVCYISPFRDGTGYSNQAVNNVLSLQAGGIDVVTRSVKLSSGSNDELAREIKHLEDKTTDGVDLVIQHLLPHMFERKNGVKNIGCFDWETTNFSRSTWTKSCDLMDEICVPCMQNRQAAIDSGVKVPIKIFPCSCNATEIKNDTSPIIRDRLLGKTRRPRLIFYTIGEMSRRKNFAGLIRGYYGAFTSRDDVLLVIKTTMSGKTPQQTADLVKKMIVDIKNSVHIHQRDEFYPPILCISNFLTTTQMNSLHRSCDVFVSPSHGEAWGIPAHTAMAFGRPAILSNWGAYPELMYPEAQNNWNAGTKTFEYVDQLNDGWLVDGQLTNCFAQTNSFPDLYTGSEMWFDPSIPHLINCLRSAYERYKNNDLLKMGAIAQEAAFRFSHEKVGKVARELLC